MIKKKIYGIISFALILTFLSSCSMSESDWEDEDSSLSDDYDSIYSDGYEDFSTYNANEFSSLNETGFLDTTISPLSTFSIDVDRASYSIIRQYLNTYFEIPPTDAVRIEEMINYFNYDYNQPTDDVPFSINTELGTCPWNENNYVAMIGLQGENVAKEDFPPSNLVFLIDVSGSMDAENRLPLLKSSFELLVEQLDENDTVSIVVYAGASGVVLEGVSGDDNKTIINSLRNLSAGGSTNGGEGIELAYKIASENYIDGGNNRVILATDGDFNVGVSSETELVNLIEEKRDDGIYLSILGFGMGNYKDNKMEKLSNAGNGNYAYIDTFDEAKKVLLEEMSGTLLTIAKDVKIQVEFNPQVVKSYRLIGYENRRLKNEDFKDDTVDAGELGAGHTVTALYEIELHDSIPTDNNSTLKYQSEKAVEVNSTSEYQDEWLEVRLRYKDPDSDTSKEIIKPVKETEYLDNNSIDYNFATAVAEFGMILQDSDYKADASFDSLYKRAKNNLGGDLSGYRENFLDLLQLYKDIQN